jgi:hypothetical protein
MACAQSTIPRYASPRDLQDASMAVMRHRTLIGRSISGNFRALPRGTVFAPSDPILRSNRTMNSPHKRRIAARKPPRRAQRARSRRAPFPRASAHARPRSDRNAKAGAVSRRDAYAQNLERTAAATGTRPTSTLRAAQELAIERILAGALSLGIVVVHRILSAVCRDR